MARLQVEEWQRETPLERDLDNGIVEGPTPDEIIAAVEAEEAAKAAEHSTFYTDELAMDADREQQDSSAGAAGTNGEVHMHCLARAKWLIGRLECRMS